MRLENIMPLLEFAERVKFIKYNSSKRKSFRFERIILFIAKSFHRKNLFTFCYKNNNNECSLLP